MNKLIIICGGDRLGKGSLIRGLCEYYDYKNVTVRHCDKPPKNIVQEKILDYQLAAFTQEWDLVYKLQSIDQKFTYHNSIIIFDRFYLGEYVYGQMFRKYNANLIKERILKLENEHLERIFKWCDVYLITLTADPEFFHSKEDGNSFSKNLEDKTKELELFKEAHEFSLIPNKLLVKVDTYGETNFGGVIMKGPNVFRPKKDILNEVINFIS